MEERQEESIMPRPRNKENLIIAATTNYEKLLILIKSRTDSEKSSCYDLSHF